MGRCTSTREPRADLALVDEDPEESAVHRRLEVGVGEEDVRRLPPQLQAHLLEGVRGGAQDGLADLEAARERDLVHVAMRHQRSARGLPEAGDDVHHSGWDAAVREGPGQAEESQRRLLRGLDHARAARAEGGRDLPGGHEQRVVPGNDLPGHAHRLLEGEGQRVVGNGQDFTVDLGGQAAVVLEAGGGVVDIELRLDDRLAGVQGLQLGELGASGADGLRDAEEDAATLLGGGIAPAAFERGPRRADRPIHVFRPRIRHLGDDLVRGRVADFQGAARGRCDPLSPDQHRLGGRHGLTSSG
jgi:hypothetical protein